MVIVSSTDKVPKALFVEYWNSIIDADLLKLRLCDVVNPTIADAYKAAIPGSYMVYDKEEERIVAEFLLNGFIGKACQVHFSMRPSNSPQQSMKLAREITSSVLNEWKTVDGEPYLMSLYGLTPVCNRAACAFVRRVGFKKIGILPGGQWTDGKAVDAMITLKTRK